MSNVALDSSSLSSSRSSTYSGKCTLDELDAMTRRRLVAAYLAEEPHFVRTGRLNREVMRKLSDHMHISSNSIWKLLTFYRDSKMRNSEREADLMSSRIRTGWKRLDVRKLVEATMSPAVGGEGGRDVLSLQLLADAFRLKYPDRAISRGMLIRCLLEVNIPQPQCADALDLIAPYFCSEDMDTTSDSDGSISTSQTLHEFIERDDPTEKMIKELQEALCFFLCVFDGSSSADDTVQEAQAVKAVKKEKKIKSPKQNNTPVPGPNDTSNLNRKRTLRDLDLSSRQQIIDAYEREDEAIPSKRLCKDKIATVGEQLGITFDTVRKMVLFYRRSKEVDPDKDPDLMSNLVTTGCKKHDERKLQRVKKLRAKFDDVSVRDLTNKYNALYCDSTMSRGTMHEYLTVLGLI